MQHNQSHTILGPQRIEPFNPLYLFHDSRLEGRSLAHHLHIETCSVHVANACSSGLMSWSLQAQSLSLASDTLPEASVSHHAVWGSQYEGKGPPAHSSYVFNVHNSRYAVFAVSQGVACRHFMLCSNHRHLN